MLTSMLALAVAATAPAAIPDNGASIGNFERDQIRNCPASSISTATKCLMDALGKTYVLALPAPENRQALQELTVLIREDFHLDDPMSPVSRDLAAKKVYSKADAANIVLADLIAQANGKKFDYAKLAVAMKNAAPRAPEIKAGPLPPERCSQPNDPPGTQIVKCYQNADGTIAVEKRTPMERSVPVVPAGALPPGIPAGSTQVATELCRAGSPLPAGVELKGCYRLPDGRLARHAVRVAEPGKN